MVPFHESDVAENRWKESEWRQFELWERIEVRLRRKRFWVITGVIFLFLAILSVPIIQERVPKWRAESAMRRLAVQVNQMKVDASSLGVPLRLRLESSSHGPIYVIDRVANCQEASPTPSSNEEWTRGQVFADDRIGLRYAILSIEDAKRLGLERIISSFCYEPAVETNPGTAITHAMGLITVKDLAESRLDRVAFLNFSGLSAEIDFD